MQVRIPRLFDEKRIKIHGKMEPHLVLYIFTANFLVFVLFIVIELRRYV